MATTAPVIRALRQTGVLISLGILVQVLSFVRPHPAAFLTFAFVGVGLVVIGLARLGLALWR